MVSGPALLLLPLAAAAPSAVPAHHGLTQRGLCTGSMAPRFRRMLGRRVDDAGPRRVVRDASIAEEPEVPGDYWKWNGHNIRYVAAPPPTAGKDAPIVILVHGFGGNCEHWRKNLPEVSEYANAYAVDLLGYGYSDKPTPPAAYPSPEQLYTFETWGAQLLDFAKDVAGANPNRKVYWVCNSVGSVAGLQAAVLDPSITDGVMLLDPSLRMLHWRKQFPLQRPLTSALQTVLRETELGRWFFSQVATPKGVRSVLQQAYHNPNAVTDDLVNAILNPGLLPGAVDVFLDFISYSGGPLPEELIPKVSCPVQILWGEEDPWEPIELGRKTFVGLPNIEKFEPLPGVGHCPMDEAPHIINPKIRDFVLRRSGSD
uniref:AB hydrolase-1 domain-containing protein n=1 Tax=Lotharella globosa TaxID=91324 RepID=A0A7S3YXF2_9EUKA